METIKQARVVFFSDGCRRFKKKKVIASQLWFQTSDGFCSRCIHPMSAAISKCIFSHLCKTKSAYSRKIPFRVCKQQHYLRKHAVMYLCKSEGGSALSIMCEICYPESHLTSVLIYTWLQNTLWQEQVVIFRTSKLCRKLVAMMIKPCLLKKT